MLIHVDQRCCGYGWRHVSSKVSTVKRCQTLVPSNLKRQLHDEGYGMTWDDKKCETLYSTRSWLFPSHACVWHIRLQKRHCVFLARWGTTATRSARRPVTTAPKARTELHLPFSLCLHAGNDVCFQPSRGQI